MGGIDETVAVMGEWPNPNPNPNPSPRTLFSSFMSEDFGSKSFSDLLNEKANPEKQKELRGDDVDEEDEGENGFSGGRLPESGVFGDQKRGNGGGLAARMAARAGFNAPRLNTARIRSGNSILASSPEVRSPYLMIPPGLSPTTLLDSPVFLSNSQGQPSPTTGTFPFPLCGQKNSLQASETDRDQFFNDIDDSSFAFKPHVESTSHPQQQFHLQTAFPEPFTRKDNTNNISSNPRVANNITVNAESNPSQTNPSITSEHSPPLEDQQDGEGDQKIEFPPAVGAPAEDGYNWRKYGQKQVKGSEYPRSYYKCTNSTCPVKKKVERSHDGHITEIIYKGAHNHPKPPPNRRSAIGFAQFENPENHGVSMNVDGESMWESKQLGTVGGALEWRNNGMETTSTASAIPEFCNPSSMQAQNGNHHESADAQEVSSALSNDDDEDDRATHGSTSLGDDADGDESESKRRKKDTCILDVGAASRAIREPRVVVQTTSEVDILDDGYRWRKYGQKVVKGNPNPRSYYKCTNAGCTVRKHVERASHDLKSVITTYEGKHNHDVPAARNNSHVNSGPASTAPASAAQTNIHRPEPSQIHDAARFDRFGGTFGLSGRQQMGPTTGFSFTMNQPRLGNMGLGGLGHQSQGRVPVLPMQSYLGQAKLSESGFMIPKGELKEEPGIEPGLPGSNSFVYQMMNRLPLGHQM